MKPSVVFIIAFIIGTALAGWIFILCSRGLIFLLMTPLGAFFLISFLGGLIFSQPYHRIKYIIPLPATLMCLFLSIEVGMRLGLRTGLFWVSLAVIIWLLTLMGMIIGIRQQAKYRKYFSPRS